MVAFVGQCLLLRNTVLFLYAWLQVVHGKANSSAWTVSDRAVVQQGFPVWSCVNLDIVAAAAEYLHVRVRFWAVQNLFWAGQCPKLGFNPPFTAQNCPKLPKTAQNCLKLPTDYESAKLILG